MATLRFPHSMVIALLLTATCLLPGSAAAEGDPDPPGGFVLKTGQDVLERRTRAARLGTSSGASDTTWIGYTPGHQGPGNWWSIYSGTGKDGFYRPVNGQPHQGVWDFETPVNGDSLQGWWPWRMLYQITGGQTRSDRNRPWWAVDIGNHANYRINQTNGRTFGVIGVWHRDGGSLQPAPPPRPTPGWAPARSRRRVWKPPAWTSRACATIRSPRAPRRSASAWLAPTGSR